MHEDSTESSANKSTLEVSAGENGTKDGDGIDNEGDDEVVDDGSIADEAEAEVVIQGNDHNETNAAIDVIAVQGRRREMALTLPTTQGTH